MNDEEIPIRAARTALAELGRDLGPLTRSGAFVIAVLAVQRASQAIEPGTSQQSQEEALTQAARHALAEAKHWSGELDRRAVRKIAHGALVGGIQKLSEQQQIVLSLRFEHDMNEREIAAVLKITEHDVTTLTAEAFEELLGKPSQ